MLSTALLAVSIAAGPAPALPACLLDVLGTGKGDYGFMTEPLGRTLLAAGVLPAHTAFLTSAHERSELFYAPPCAEKARALAARLHLEPDAVKPVSWKTRYGLTLAVSPAETKQLESALASKDPARIRAAALPLADGRLLLGAATEQDDPELARLTLEVGVFVDAQTCHALAESGKARALKIFAGRVPVCATSDALVEAAQRGHLEAVRVLLDAGVPASVASAASAAQGRSPLSVAGTPQVASLLLARGARIDELLRGGTTPLHANPNPSVLELLLSKGARVDARDAAGWTPLHHAAMAGDPARIKLLLARGADPQARTQLGRESIGEWGEASIFPAGSTPLDLVRGAANPDGDDGETRSPAEEALVAAGARANVAMRGDCPREVERAGFAARGDAYALHWRCTVDPEHESKCGYPPLSGNRNAGDEVTLCTGARGCAGVIELHAYQWVAGEPAPRCMPADAARAAQALADAELRARDITFAPPLARGTTPNRFRLPAGMLKAYGIAGQAWVVYGGSADDEGRIPSKQILLEVEGVPPVELQSRECSEMCINPHYEYGGAFAPADGHLLITGFKDELQAFTPEFLAARLLGARAEARLARSDAAGALEDAERAVKLDPAAGEAAYAGARAAARLGRAEKALDLLERAARSYALAVGAAREADFAALRTQPRFLQLVHL